ncbi:MAG: heme o synthase [Candidatus Bathyarchaeota archaeon]|nr:heme o synthase [Candidatus Bathyarchaeota archaeon]
MDKTFKYYLELTKPKVTLLNLLVAITCFVLASFPTVDCLKLAVFSIVGYLAAGGCGVLNSVYDNDIDRLMARTSKRAIPAGNVTSRSAMLFGVFLTLSSLVASYLLFNALTALMVSLGMAFYLLVYTVWLKRKSPWNVVIGGLAGCFAAFSGWSAAVDALSLTPLLIAALDFLWTPGHLWGLAIKKMKEYQGAGVPMLPVAVGKTKASKIVFWMNASTVVFSFLLPFFGFSGMLYLAVAMFAGAFFIVQSLRLLTFPDEERGLKVFLASMPYLACLMLGLIADKVFLL